MFKNWRIALLMLVAVAFSLGTIGCKSSGRDGQTADQKSDEKPDRPKGDHPQH